MDSDFLDDIGILHGTDKSSLRWDYLRQYQDIFRDFRDRKFTLLEIGVASGSSLHSWRQFFSRATIVGVDIDERARRVASNKIEVEIGSQADEVFLKNLCTKYNPEIIIDDGSHQADHIMVSFRTLFPLLDPGGWYVIEDLNITGGLDNAFTKPHVYFTNLAQSMLHRRPTNLDDSEYLQQIDRIDFAPGVVMVRKKDPARERRRLTAASQLVYETDKPNNYLWLAEQMCDQEADLQKAEESARRAVELYPDAAVYLIGLSKVLEKRRKFDDAVIAAQQATVADPNAFEPWFQLGRSRAKAGIMDAASEAFAMALTVAPEYLRLHIENRRKSVMGELSRGKGTS